MSQTPPLRAALIGLGNIGFGFDASTPLSGVRDPLTQAGAMAASPDVVLAGAASPDPDQRQAFVDRYGAPAFATAEAMLDALKPNLVGVCSPTPLHFTHTSLCLQAGVSMIWLEKPACATADELERLVALAEARPRATVAVNFMRRHLPGYQTLIATCRDRSLGHLLAMQITYGPGLLVNGSHMLDLAFACAGDTGDWTLLDASFPQGPENPWFTCLVGRDPAGHGVPVSAVGLAPGFHTNDLTLTFEAGRASLLAGGMEARIERRVEHELFPGFSRLADDPRAGEGLTGLEGAMANALADLVAAHRQGRRPASDLRTSLRSQALIEAVLSGARA